MLKIRDDMLSHPPGLALFTSESGWLVAVDSFICQLNCPVSISHWVVVANAKRGQILSSLQYLFILLCILMSTKMKIKLRVQLSGVQFLCMIRTSMRAATTMGLSTLGECWLSPKHMRHVPMLAKMAFAQHYTLLSKFSIPVSTKVEEWSKTTCPSSPIWSLS